MVFSSSVFLFLFLPLTLSVYYNPWLKGRRFRNIVLFAASIVFYAWGERKFVFLMLFSIMVNWLLGRTIAACNRNYKAAGEKKRRKWGKTWFVIALVFDLGMLFLFKYAAFAAKNINYIFGGCLPVIDIALPIGISFFTFQILSYIIDVYRGKVKEQKNFWDLGLYISMFPQLVAGPIVRYGTIAEEIGRRQENRADFVKGFQRFVYGLGKKALIANYMAVVADNIFTFSDSISVTTAWLGIIAYTLQIYFDFSGYSDMAIGLGGMFGFHFNENFNYPYISKSVTEFWRRWHISLSSWFRDYVYIPLGGSRCSHLKWIRNMFVVWLLTGIWHGANWTFLVWGIVFFIVLLFEKSTGFPYGWKVASHIYTLLVVMLAWVFFRSPSLADAVSYIGVMFGIGADGMTDRMGMDLLASCRVLLPIAVLCATPVYKKMLDYLKGFLAGAIVENMVLLCIFVLSLLACMKSSYNPFIYFNF